MGYKLDEKGFVFIDGLNRPYLVRMYHDVPMSFYWHPDKHWVTWRGFELSDIIAARGQKVLSEEQAQIYHNLHNEWNS